MKLTNPKIEIKTDGVRAKILFDGNEIEGVLGYSISHDAGHLPILNLRVRGTDLDFETQVLPALPEPWAQLYVPKSQDDDD